MGTQSLSRSLLLKPTKSLTSLSVLFSRSFSSSSSVFKAPTTLPGSFLICRTRPLAAAFASTVRRSGTEPRALSTRAVSSSLSDPNPNWSNRPPKETILLDGCDFEHWLVVMEKPEGDPTRDEIIDKYIKTLAQVVGSEEEARMKIYSVSTRCYYAFGALVSEELSYKLKELPGVRWVLPDSYLDVKNKDYGGEPFINGQAVPYDPKYHEEWIRNNARANERNRRNDRPRNFDRSRNFERRREHMRAYQDMGNRSPPPNVAGPPQGSMGPPPNMGGPPHGNMGPPPNMAGPPQGNMGPPPNVGGMPPQGNMGPPPNVGGMPPQGNMGTPPNMGRVPPQGNMGPPPNMGGMPPQGNMGPPPNMGGMPPQGNVGPPPNMGGMPLQGNMGPPPNVGGMPPPNMGGMPPPNTGGMPPQGNMGPPPNMSGMPPRGDMGPNTGGMPRNMGSPPNMGGMHPNPNNPNYSGPPNVGGGPPGGWSGNMQPNFQQDNPGMPYQGQGGVPQNPQYPRDGGSPYQG